MKKILLVDDMQGIRESLTIILESKYDIDVEKNASEGLKKIYENQYDLVITDIIMPDIDGNEFILQIKKFCSTPILAISAGGNNVSSQQALIMAEQQADAVLEKPFSKHELYEKIDSVIQ